MLSVLTVSYHTLGAYKVEAEQLEESAKTFGVELHSVSMPEPASWIEGWKGWGDVVSWKPAFLVQELDKWKSYDGLLYTDADSSFTAAPDFSIFETTCFSAHWFQRTKNHEPEILTGTLYLANVPLVREFLVEWAEATPPFRNTFTPEQNSLKRIWPNWKDRLNFKDLPPEWVWIKGDFDEYYGKRSPVIVHRQASRKHRNAKKS